MSAGTAITDFGSAAADLLMAEGSREAAKAYGQASAIATSNSNLTLRSGQIQEEQESRAITQALGSENADVASAGFKNSGSALYLMKSSLQQGALAKQLISNQTEITAQGYQQQAAAYTGQEKSAEFQAQADDASAAASAAAGAVDTPSSIVSFLTFGIL